MRTRGCDVSGTTLASRASGTTPVPRSDPLARRHGTPAEPAGRFTATDP